MSWTTAQEEAINSRECNLLVAAAAGSGKTAVLVERIIQLLIRDRVDIDRMLIVTFTQAAAGEMRERISKALQGELDKADDQDSGLRRQIKLLNQASISTLHAFCAEVLRRYFHLLGIDPGFRIADSMESDLIKLEVLEDVFEAAYEKEEPDFLDLVEAFGTSKSDRSLQEMVLQTHEFAQCKPSPREWLKERVADFNMGKAEFARSPWLTNMVEHITLTVQAARELFQEASKICGQPEGPARYAEALQADMDIADALLSALKQTDVFDFYRKVEDISPLPLPRVGKEVNPVLKEQAQALRKEAKELLKRVRKDFLFKEPERLLNDINQMHPLMEALYALVADFHTEYARCKADKNLLDFNDLEHYALEVLSHPEAAAEYRQKYQYIFVDEYQDSNEVQETLINYIKQDNNVFLVGDIKQSIYRFRLADPTLFMQKMYEYRESGEGLNRRIDLSVNFRSRAEILDGVNYIFKHTMSPYLGEIEYDDRATLYPGLEKGDKEGRPIELYLIDKKREEDEGDELAQAGEAEIEARFIAAKINELVGQPIYDHKIQGLRPLQYRDIVVLMRSTRNWLTPFWEVFTAEGIPVYADMGSGYFQAGEITVVLNLLRLIDNRRQDIPLLSVMRSPIGAFSLEELIEIRVFSPGSSYYDALEAYRQGNEDELGAKVDRFMRELKRWKREAHYLPIDEYIWKLLQETGYYYYVEAMPGGRQRQANLRALLDRARQFQNSSIKGLFNFIKYVDKIQTRSADMGVARVLGENENLVRIMSIHRSKGLEFPVVIVAGMGKQFNMTDSSAKILLHKDLGLGPRYVNTDLRSFGDTVARSSIRQKIRLENLSEEMRILYVACTRAQDRLIMTGSLNNIEACCQRWSKTISPFNLARGKNALDWVGPALMRHPEGEILRAMAGQVEDDLQIFQDLSRWRIGILKRGDTVAIYSRETELSESLCEQWASRPAGEEAALIRQRLEWQYPFAQAERIPSKLSVSMLKAGRYDPDFMGVEMPAALARPRLAEGLKPLSPAQKGSVMHFVIQHLDLRRVDALKDIEAQINLMVEREMLQAEEAETVRTGKIRRFFASPLGQRILSSGEVYREVAFNRLRSAAEVMQAMETIEAMDGSEVCQEQLLIQGVIDLYFYEGDEIVLVDFKTDYIDGENREDLINFYRPQLMLYREALEAIQNRKVKESYLYFFGINEAVLLG